MAQRPAAAAEWLLYRTAQRRVHGPAMPDELAISWVCRRCGTNAASADRRLLYEAPYRDIDALVETAVQAAAMATHAGPACPSCSGEQTPAQVDYHVSHSLADCDLVVRWRPRTSLLTRARTELLWWDAGLGYTRTETLSDDEAQAIEHDAVLRAVRAAWETGGARRAAPVIEEAVERIGGEPALLDYVSALYAGGEDSVARAVAQTHADRHRDDPIAPYWLGHMIVQDVSRGQWPQETLADAEAHLKRALAQRPDYPEAEMELAHAARLRGRDDIARAALFGLVSRHPDHVEATYALGMLQLRVAPDQALETFSHGRAVAPHDPDCARGRVRALLLLHRLDEARTALENARRLAPADPRLRELETTLAAR